MYVIIIIYYYALQHNTAIGLLPRPTYLSLVCLTTCFQRWLTSVTFSSRPGGGEDRLSSEMHCSATASWSNWNTYTVYIKQWSALLCNLDHRLTVKTKIHVQLYDAHVHMHHALIRWSTNGPCSNRQTNSLTTPPRCTLYRTCSCLIHALNV